MYWKKIPAILALKLIEGLALLLGSKRLLQEDTSGPMKVLMVQLVYILN